MHNTEDNERPVKNDNVLFGMLTSNPETCHQSALSAFRPAIGRNYFHTTPALGTLNPVISIKTPRFADSVLFCLAL